MEYAKDEIFNIQYNQKVNRLQIKRTSTLWDKLKKHKLITGVVTMLITFSFLDVLLIWQFTKILENFS